MFLGDFDASFVVIILEVSGAFASFSNGSPVGGLDSVLSDDTWFVVGLGDDGKGGNGKC